MRMTKIVATLGPAVNTKDSLRAVIAAGADVLRLNFSHGTHEEHIVRLKMIDEIRSETDKPICLLADTRGPEVRLGTFAGDSAELVTGDRFKLTTQPCEGDSSQVFVTYEALPREIGKGTRILLDDGLIELVVDSTSDTEIHTTVANGGVISSRKSVNIPSVRLGLPFISGKDRADLRFIADNGFDYIAASFTRNEQDIRQLRDELHRINAGRICIISKIENAEGVSNMQSIIDASDGVMVARGDLGVEIALEEIPVVQKKMIEYAYRSGKHVITATQMLESMIRNPRPTRAEASDVANAVYDGTSAVMLSGETAAGRYPAEAVRTMSRISERAERDINYHKRFLYLESKKDDTIPNAISHATVSIAYDLSAKAILTVTKSGSTARNISKFRPSCPIISCTTDPRVLRQLRLTWGVIPLLIEEQSDTDSLFSVAVEAAFEKGLISGGDLIVITAGVPLGVSGTTNLLKVHVVGE